MTEKTIDRYLSRKIKGLGGWSIKLPAIHVSGLPDRMCLLPGGRIFFAEIKSPGDKPRKIQIHMMKKIRKLGFRVEVIDSNEKVLAILKDYE